MKKYFFLLCSVLYMSTTWACTSFIISGRVTPSGRPMMFKHRDTGELNNRIAHFQGPKYSFIGLVNSPTLDGEVWAGMNEAGLCIMNTASYNLRQDTYDCQMDREGELMYNALGCCATLGDFEQWLTTYPQPWGVEANFGLIDAQGGAAYYEMNNDSWIKYDVNAESEGYRVVTNFSFAGSKDKYQGWERYLTASSIMKDAFDPTHQMSACEALNLFSRQYKHELLDVLYTPQNAPQYIVDQDFIPRRITSAVVVFEGVKAQQDPKRTVMWTTLGYPTCAVAIPLFVHKESIPNYIQARDVEIKKGNDLHSEMCDISMAIKNKWVFPLVISNGKKYIALQNVLCDTPERPSLLTCTNKVERNIEEAFVPLYTAWHNEEITDQAFYESYKILASQWLIDYKTTFADYIK